MIEYKVEVHANGDKYWYLNGKIHREDGPAIDRANGDKFWALKGKIHREDGPAIEYADGVKSWYLNGHKLTEQEWKAKVSKTSCEGREVEIDGVTYVLKEKNNE